MEWEVSHLGRDSHAQGRPRLGSHARGCAGRRVSTPPNAGALTRAHDSAHIEQALVGIGGIAIVVGHGVKVGVGAAPISTP